MATRALHPSAKGVYLQVKFYLMHLLCSARSLANASFVFTRRLTVTRFYGILEYNPLHFQYCKLIIIDYTKTLYLVNFAIFGNLFKNF